MRRVLHSLCALAFVLALIPAPASAQMTLPTNCSILPIPPTVALVCTPTAPWNGDLVVFAHGFVAPGPDLTKGFEQLVTSDGQFLPSIVTSLGYAFVASSYSKNGLAVVEGVADTADLVRWFKSTHPGTHNVYLTGASEGGLVTALSVERMPGLYSGGLAVCGPIGDFRNEINYLGDFRVIFDYFFKGVLPGTAVVVPDQLPNYWESTYAPAIAGAVSTNPGATDQLLRVTRAAVDPSVPDTRVRTALSVLWYSAFATMDAQAELHGQPYDNHNRWYFGSANDWLLNRTVPRYTADSTALASLTAYQTTGRLRRPLVTMHTLLDPVVPYSQESLYTAKTLASGSWAKRINIPIARYGHCNVTSGEILAGFALLVFQSSGQQVANPRAALPAGAARDDFDRVMKEHGRPK